MTPEELKQVRTKLVFFFEQVQKDHEQTMKVIDELIAIEERRR